MGTMTGWESPALLPVTVTLYDPRAVWFPVDTVRIELAELPGLRVMEFGLRKIDGLLGPAGDIDDDSEMLPENPFRLDRVIEDVLELPM